MRPTVTRPSIKKEKQTMIARRMLNFPSLDWHHPFAEMERMARQMDLLDKAIFARPPMRWMPSSVFPAVNISEDKDQYFVRAELPGIKADEIDLQVNGRNLTISGERKIRSEGNSAKYHRREREAGKFSRVVGLPGDIDADRVDAKMVNGLLTVAISKSAASKPKQIPVH
jgi:HSP20 family protein